MGSIHEFCAEFHISLKKAQRMDKRGWLRISEKSTPVDEIRIVLKRGDRLTVGQLCELIENPAGLAELGTYMDKAEAQLAALGDVKSQVAPFEVAAHILEAYQNQADSVAVIAQWLASIIPSKPVGHAYLAVRLLMGVSANIRQDDVPRMQRVLFNCRSHPVMAGLWRSEKQGKRSVTLYQKIPLANLDL